jgi:hypothetical protein
METLSQFALLAIIVVGVPTIGVIIVAGVIDLARLILGADAPVRLRGEVVDRGSDLHGRASPSGQVATK